MVLWRPRCESVANSEHFQCYDRAVQPETDRTPVAKGKWNSKCYNSRVVGTYVEQH
jgi:hypothetical protein